jgi:hypothetical protein
MKFSIQWHENCLKNVKAHYQEQARMFEITKARLEETRFYMVKYEQQIERAKRLKKDGFDSEKFSPIDTIKNKE